MGKIKKRVKPAVNTQHKKRSRPMKKLLIFIVMFAGAFFLSAQAHAARALDLSGNDYNTYILCNNDVGSFCSQRNIETETFVFSGNTFEIQRFEDGLEGLASDGDFSAGGLSFNANYTGYDGLSRYDFNIRGLTIFDIIILGRMDITFKEIDLSGTNTEEGSALFLGIRN
jgi:hypothetical protein